MQYLCNKHGLVEFYPTRSGERAMVDSAMFYLIGTLYPLVARATYPALGFPQYPGEVGALGRRRRDEGEGAAGRRWRRIAEPLDVYRSFFLDGKQFIGGDHALDRRHPSGGDPRVPAARSTTTLPAWAKDYMAAMEDVARRGVLGAGGRRARLHRLRQVTGLSLVVRG